MHNCDIPPRNFFFRFLSFLFLFNLFFPPFISPPPCSILSPRAGLLRKRPLGNAREPGGRRPPLRPALLLPLLPLLLLLRLQPPPLALPPPRLLPHSPARSPPR
ncbi:hypothetical protein H1C71_033950 [Ictidomys tridecemlineatus]|nr:hypothetical protein H1C71_033950 [Ictidomys tridecemlineatus]